ncbi:MAG: 8-amino-7-oxononanoate synthase, partial [Cyanobacteria bacterium SIG29]|nr:8-amino-7-oxononanoate synthase [Cyanobacteria bacterium SIG29]
MNFYDEEIKKLVEKDNFRQVKDIEEKHGKFLSVNGKNLLNFSSNDYLNLSTDKDLINEFIEKY